MTQQTIHLAAPRLPDFSARGLVTEGTASSWAVFSPDRLHRYVLARMWDDYFQTGGWWEQTPTRPLMVVVGQNPSNADAFKNDPTVTRCIGFAKRERCGGLLLVNRAAGIATKKSDLWKLADPIGEHNLAMIRWALKAPLLAIGVAAWGHVTPKFDKRTNASKVEALCARGLFCLGRTEDGEPRHPLMLRADTPLVSMRDGRAF